MKGILGHIRLVPLLAMVVLLSFAVRLGDFVTGLNQSGAAFAQQEVKASPPPLPAAQDQAAPPPPSLPAAPAATAADVTLPPSLPGAPAMKDATAIPSAAPTDAGKGAANWKDAGDTEIEFSKSRDELYGDLEKRRKELDQREKELATREALMKAGARELDQKMNELSAVRDEIKGLLKNQSEEQNSRVESLVKIYEGMKTTDAARIFDTLDMGVLVSVMSRMSERKISPVLAAMNPDRARAVTTLLAQQNKLPDLLPQ